ncbi:hypothetical protein DSL64_05035 [Dyadobacter luteus]|uniref:Resolvase/invertase-type recombinase catalytic domain-containing protein n=1 Tax=Dyadobacter luteus TaxID=2259619 RepID=A0A3D8YJ08_9BACT|nr:recombinase family protein [Dyadobacter luteus]REA63790.1 hypothetical protein DSL64_05035 [Dyadobacter luteus]
MVKDFAKKGIVFRVLDLGIESSTPAWKMVIGISESLAEYEWEMILENTRAVQLLAKSERKTSK